LVECRENIGEMLALATRGRHLHSSFGSLITNASAYKKVSEMFRQPGDGKMLWMVFRAGYSKEPVRSYRLDVDELIMK